MGEHRAGAGAVLLVAAAIALVGCRPEILPEQERESEIDALEVTVTLDGGGTAHVRERYEFASDDGGTIGLPQLLGQPFAGIGNLAVDGAPTTPTAGTFAPQLRIPRRESIVTYDVQGAAERYADVAILRLDVLGAPEDTSRQDPNVDLTGTLVLPEGPPGAIEAHLHGTRDPLVTVDGSTVKFSGEAPVWSSSHSLDVAFPPDRLPNVSAVAIPFLASFQQEQQTRSAADMSLDSTLDDLDTGVEIGRWVVTGLAFGLPAIAWLAVGAGVLRRLRERKRMVGYVPDHVVDPPTAADPAVVSVLDGEGRPDRKAVAGTVLALAERKAVDLQQYGDKLVVRVPLETTPTNESERIVLDALRKGATPDGRVEGPPIFDGAPWWRSFRRDAVARARQQGLAIRWLPIATLSGAIVMTAVGVAIFFFMQPGIFVFVVGGAQFLSVLASLLGGYTLTNKGWRERALWRAFGRYIDDQGKLERDVGPEGVRVWGPYLTYGSVLGEAPGAARPLTP